MSFFSLLDQIIFFYLDCYRQPYFVSRTYGYGIIFLIVSNDIIGI